MTDSTADKEVATDSPTAWFSVLERALRTEDYELAARAKRELGRLGVEVSFKGPGKRKAVRRGR